MKFYCVGCKKHYELDPMSIDVSHSANGNRTYYWIMTKCPENHNVKKSTNETVWLSLQDNPEITQPCRSCGELFVSQQPGCEACYEIYLDDYDQGADCSSCCWENDVDNDLHSRYWNAEGMTVGVNLEALAPTADEPESGTSLVPADSLMPEGSGRTIGSQSVSHNYTPFHSEFAAESDCYSCGRDLAGRPQFGKYCSKCGNFVCRESCYFDEDDSCSECTGVEIWDSEDIDWEFWTENWIQNWIHEGPQTDEQLMYVCSFMTDEDCDLETATAWAIENSEDLDFWDKVLTELEDDDAATLVVNEWIFNSAGESGMDAEEFIAHRSLKDHLLSVMPNKIYGVKELDDGDFEMRVADRHMDEVIEAVSEYQTTESDSSDSFFLGQSKSTVAAVAAVAALGLTFWYNRR